MRLLERARRALEEEHTLQSEVEELRSKAAARGVLLTPIEELERILWPSAVEAALLGCLRCRVVPDPGSLEAAATLVLWLGEAAEKGEKGEKPTPRWISYSEIRDLLARIYLGHKARLTEDGRVEIIDAHPTAKTRGGAG